MPPSRHRPGIVRLAVLGVSASALVAVPLAGSPASAAEAAPVDIQLLSINDFHGRIDNNTTGFATTIEKLRAESGEDNTLFVSNGDNIGASLFTSSVQQDAPTIELLNLLGLGSSSVGNHEFDRGFADLTGRVAELADFPYLGANVYEKGTQNPALEEYELHEVGGITVGVIGAVTEETPTLVSPDGVSSLDFGDPVAAVNRVAAQLSDGDAGNGEADVIVAQFHEGAPSGSATLAESVAASEAFASIVNETSAAVDVIFTGHTHQTYAYDAPVPGATGTTRPILQTGSYGANVGQVKLTYDASTDAVTAYTQRNVARMAADLTLPRVQATKTLVDKAVAEANELGKVQVGEVEADVTTAFSGGAYGENGYAGGSRDDRANESTLGDFVANALVDALPARLGEADLSFVNSGGLRAELLYKASEGVAGDADGVITFSEAAAVLPFGNNISLVELTGAQVKAVLEEQWQTNADGTVPSRSYIHLGLPDNVRVTADETRPRGDRITSIRIDGTLIDPAQTYTVSTFDFLAAGGDNFRSLAQGPRRDTGIGDAELWVDYLGSQTASPDFARQQVWATGLPESVQAGDAVDVDLRKLDLTSLGSPKNTSVDVTLVKGDEKVAIDSYDVTDGAASVDFTAPADLDGAWGLSIVAQPSGTVVGEVVVQDSELRVSAPAVRYGASPVIRVAVDSEGASTGTVELRVGSGAIRTADVVDGVATFTLPRRGQLPATYDLRARYSGDETTREATANGSLRVAKASSSVSVRHSAITRGRQGRLAVTVYNGSGLKANGVVRVQVSGRTIRTRVTDGRATVTLPAFPSAGTRTARVTYEGTGRIDASAATYRFYVR